VSEPRRVRAEIRNVVFPVVVRGYDRRAVDVYVTRVNRLIAELEATRSPENAVKRALKRTEAERDAILEQAREAAAAITASAKAEAVDIVVNANVKADRTKAETDEHAAKVQVEAERILAEARAKAAAQLQRAQAEIGALREEAETWVRELRTDTTAIWGERRELLDELRDISARLQKAASQAEVREALASASLRDQ
jgi:DivIVA domain-containing protein